MKLKFGKQIKKNLRFQYFGVNSSLKWRRLQLTSQVALEALSLPLLPYRSPAKSNIFVKIRFRWPRKVKKKHYKSINVAFYFLGYSDQDVVDLQFQSFHNPQLLFVSCKSLLMVCLWLLLKISDIVLTRVASIATANPVGFREVGFCRLRKKSN